MPDEPNTPEREEEERERWALLREIDEVKDTPLVVLSFIWVGLLILELAQGLTGFLPTLVLVIWGIFVLDFVIEFIIAPKKRVYLRNSWLTAIALIIPAFRMLRIFPALRMLRAARFIRSTNLVRILTSTNRGLRAMRAALGRRGFGYIVLATVMVLFIAAGGILQFESPGALQRAGYEDTAGIEHYGDAVWWTAMVITTFGSDYWPQTPEGRTLTVVLSVYSVAVFGYITATIASMFISSDISSREEREARRGRQRRRRPQSVAATPNN
jgi:voltage-gated potassium channel